jgi:undecaprenyl-diphosphatase
MYELDRLITNWTNNLSGHNSLLDDALILVTNFGVPIMVVAVAAQWWIGTDRPRARHAAVACGLSFLLGLAVNQLILLFLHRARPYDAGLTHLLLTPTADPSFPSDHATASFAIVFGYLLNGRPQGAALSLVGALIIGFSRIYVGTHYLSDILGGAATALLGAAIVQAMYRKGTRLDRWVVSVL